MSEGPSVAVVAHDDPLLEGLVSVLPPMGSEEAWLGAHEERLGADPQVNRFQKEGAAVPAFEVIEVHPESPQLTIASDADLLVAIYPPGWEPGDPEQPSFAVRVPAGWGSVIEPGVWHSGVCALGDTPVMAAFRPRTLEDATEVHHLGRPVAFDH